MNKLFLVFLGIWLVAVPARAQQAKVDIDSWPQAKSTHFVVVYAHDEDQEAASAILRRAEEYYNSVTDLIGYTRYRNFWTWDERVKILYFSDQSTYASMTGQPPWSKGFSVTHLNSFALRMIVSYRGQENFLTSVLPHEISHLVLHDFMGQGRPVPLWFDEGVAQMDEERDDADYRRVVARLVVSGKSIPLTQLAKDDVRAQKDPLKVSIFYAETLYIIDFLVKTYGKDAFRELCRGLREGKGFEETLKSAYYPTIGSLKILEDKWNAHMRAFLSTS